MGVDESRRGWTEWICGVSLLMVEFSERVSHRKDEEKPY